MLASFPCGLRLIWISDTKNYTAPKGKKKKKAACKWLLLSITSVLKSLEWLKHGLLAVEMDGQILKSYIGKMNPNSKNTRKNHSEASSQNVDTLIVCTHNGWYKIDVESRNTGNNLPKDIMSLYSKTDIITGHMRLRRNKETEQNTKKIMAF